MKRRTLFMLIVVVALVGAGGLFFYRQQSNTAQAATTTRSTATITRGSLTASVTGAGNIYAPQQTSLSFALTGAQIKSISVQVEAGQVLALEDDTDLQYSLRSAQSQLTSAQAALDKLKQPAAQTDVNA